MLTILVKTTQSKTDKILIRNKFIEFEGLKRKECTSVINLRQRIFKILLTFKPFILKRLFQKKILTESFILFSRVGKKTHNS